MEKEKTPPPCKQQKIKEFDETGMLRYKEEPQSAPVRRASKSNPETDPLFGVGSSEERADVERY